MIKEHTLADKNSHVFKHLNSSLNCKSQYTSNCFEVLDFAKTSYRLKFKVHLAPKCVFRPR